MQGDYNRAPGLPSQRYYTSATTLVYRYETRCQVPLLGEFDPAWQVALVDLEPLGKPVTF
jgi:hypothetical protein